MGLPQLRPEETASHDLEIFYHVAGVRVAIDVAKLTHQVLLELPSGKRRVHARREHQGRDRSLGGDAPRLATCRARSRSSRPATTIGRWPTSSGRPAFSSALGVVDRRRSHARGAVQHLGQERSEGRAGHSASAEERDDAAVSRSAGHRASGPAGDGEHLSAGVAAEGAAPAQPGHAPLAAVSSQKPSAICTAPAPSGSPSCCCSRRVPPRCAATPKTAFVAAATRADRRPQGRQGADGSPTSMTPRATAWGCRCRRDVGDDAHVSGGARGVSGALPAAQAPGGRHRRRGWRTSRTSSGCRPCRASGRFSR